MSPEPTLEPPLTPDEQRAREALRALAPPRADAAYRARLAREFASGTIGRAGARATPLPLPARRRLGFAWAALPVAAAAALMVVGTLNRGPGWELVSSRGAGELLIDGVAVSMERAADLERRLKPGARLKLPAEGELEIAIAGQVAMQILAGTEVTLPASAGRWIGRSVHAAIAGGELRITTGARFRGARLAIRTPEVTVDVTGTTLAVIREPGGTCVCVLEGRVMVGPRAGGARAPVEEGHLRFTFNDARPPMNADIRPLENEMLREFREERRALMEKN
jgi:ferric-dicitrate binding protein FerR (iron transport regulator)